MSHRALGLDSAAARVAGIVVAGLLAVGSGCGTNGGGGGGGGTLSGLTVRVSDLVVDAIGDIRVDDNVIAVGTGENGGIEYLLPKQATTTFNIQTGDNLITSGFAVANGWIAARQLDGDVFLHDTATATTTAVPRTTLALPSGNAATNEFWADEQFIVTFADDTVVSDGHAIKLIDCSTAPPTITSFTQDLPAQPFGIAERVLLAIDADQRQVMALQQDIFYLYDMDDPTAAPQTLDVSLAGGASNAFQFQFNDGFVVYHERDLTSTGLRTTRFLDIANLMTTPFPENPSEPLDMLLVNGQFGYFVNQRDEDVNVNSTTRSVWGTLDAAGPAYTQEHLTDQFIGNDRGDGLIGYGRTLAATKDGVFRFLAGGGNSAIAEILQVSRDGGEFTAVPTIQQFRNESPDGLPATEVVTSNDICAFRVGGDDQVGYILLP